MKLALILTHLSAEAFSDASLGGISSVGRALAWHARGQEFDSPMLHHFHYVVMMVALDLVISVLALLCHLEAEELGTRISINGYL